MVYHCPREHVAHVFESYHCVLVIGDSKNLWVEGVGG